MITTDYTEKLDRWKVTILNVTLKKDRRRRMICQWYGNTSDLFCSMLGRIKFQSQHGQPSGDIYFWFVFPATEPMCWNPLPRQNWVVSDGNRRLCQTRSIRRGMRVSRNPGQDCINMTCVTVLPEQRVLAGQIPQNDDHSLHATLWRRIIRPTTGRRRSWKPILTVYQPWE